MNQLYLDLCKVKALLVAGWGQDAGRDETRLCLFDATDEVACQHPLNSDARQAPYDAIYDELVRTQPDQYSMVAWNDDPSRTKAEVIDLVQRAANRAGGGESRTGDVA